MTIQSVFTVRLIAHGYTVRARETQTITASETDTERINFGEPFNITVSYEVEHFGIGLPMYVVGSDDKTLVPSAFYYDSEQRVQAHLYRLDSGDYLVVQRCSSENGGVRYIVELYSQNKTRKTVLKFYYDNTPMPFYGKPVSSTSRYEQ